MKKILLSIIFVLGAICLYSQTIRPVPEWSITTGGLHVGTLTATTAVITTGTVTNITSTNATITTVSATDFSASAATVTTLALLGTSTTKTLTVTGDISASGGVTSTGIFLADSSLYFGDDYKKNWNRFAYQQVGVPASRLMLENLADISIQNKTGNGQVLAIQRDTTGSTAKINLPNVLQLTATKVKHPATDTTGVGSTANVGTMMYYEGHFYGLKAGTPPVWVQLDN